MQYFYQPVSESGSFSNPEPREVRSARSRAELEEALDQWERAHHRVGSEPKDASLLVWVQRVPDAAMHVSRFLEPYPDKIATRGPRGGFRLTDA